MVSSTRTTLDKVEFNCGLAVARVYFSSDNIIQRRAAIYFMKMAVFWVVAPCSLVEVHQHFRGPCSSP
jgi:hypothetical protein